VDEMFLVPHFEKMLYDNALLCDTYTNAYLAYGDETHLQIAKEVADFWHNFMSEDALFYSASDADSEGAEGSYFIYSYEEVYNALKSAGYTDVEKMCANMSLTQDGNFEGKNIIRFEEGELPEWFGDIKVILAKIRAQREYPFIDKKVQTSWSSMMISSLFKLGSIDTTYTQRAIQNLDALLKTMLIDKQLYHTTLIHKSPKVKAFLEDYAFLSQALLLAFKYTTNEIYLIQAQTLVNKALEEFYENGVWSFSVGEFVTKAEISDNTYISPVSIIIDSLLTLGTLLEDEKYTHFAFKTMEYNSYELGRKPIYFPYLLTQTLRYIKGDRIIKASLDSLTTNSLELAKLEYPFISYKVNHEDGFMICGDKSCFANTADIDEINKLLLKSF